MEGKLELFSQGMQSSWFMSGMGVPGSKVVKKDGFAGAQGRDTFAWEGLTTDMVDQLFLYLQLGHQSTVHFLGR